jgi:hypothetical protein
MITKRLFSHDPEFGVTKFWHADDESDKCWIETVQDIEPLLKDAYECRKETQGTRWGDGAHVAYIPAFALAEAYASGNQINPDYWRRWLNDPNNVRYRTRPGKV